MTEINKFTDKFSYELKKAGEDKVITFKEYEDLKNAASTAHEHTLVKNLSTNSSVNIQFKDSGKTADFDLSIEFNLEGNHADSITRVRDFIAGYTKTNLGVKDDAVMNMLIDSILSSDELFMKIKNGDTDYDELLKQTIDAKLADLKPIMSMDESEFSALLDEKNPSELKDKLAKTLGVTWFKKTNLKDLKNIINELTKMKDSPEILKGMKDICQDLCFNISPNNKILLQRDNFLALSMKDLAFMAKDEKELNKNMKALLKESYERNKVSGILNRSESGIDNKINNIKKLLDEYSFNKQNHRPVTVDQNLAGRTAVIISAAGSNGKEALEDIESLFEKINSGNLNLSQQELDLLKEYDLQLINGKLFYQDENGDGTLEEITKDKLQSWLQLFKEIKNNDDLFKYFVQIGSDLISKGFGLKGDSPNVINNPKSTGKTNEKTFKSQPNNRNSTIDEEKFRKNLLQIDNEVKNFRALNKIQAKFFADKMEAIKEEEQYHQKKLDEIHNKSKFKI